MKKNKKAPTFVNTQILILIIYRVYLAFHTYFILQHLQVDIDSGINLPLCYYFFLFKSPGKSEKKLA